MRTSSWIAPLLALGLLAAAPSSAALADSKHDRAAHSDDDHDRDRAQTSSAYHSRAARLRALKVKQADARQQRRAARSARANNPWWPFYGPPGLF